MSLDLFGTTSHLHNLFLNCGYSRGYVSYSTPVKGLCCPHSATNDLYSNVDYIKDANEQLAAVFSGVST